LLAASNASIEALGNDIRQAVVDDDLDLDIRIFTQELRKLRHKNRIRRMFGGCDPNSAGGLRPKLADRRHLGLDLLESGAHRVKQPLARLRRRDTPRGTGQEPNSQPSLELADRVA
jgi:hypothetical protein